MPDGPAELEMQTGSRVKTVRLSPLAALRPHGRIPNLAKSALRALDVVELLVGTGPGLREIDIARAMRMSPSSADQILKTLVDSGYILLDGITKRYQLSPRLMRLAEFLDESYFPQRILDALVREVHRRTGATVILAVPQHSYMQILDVYDASSRTAHLSRAELVGMHTPFFGSCTGAAWLSTQSEATVRKLIHRCRRELGSARIDAEPILESVRQIRQQGYAFGGLMAEQGMLSIAVPLPPAPNGLVLVLAATGPTERIERRERAIVLGIQRVIARHLGR
jgi:DNA-binding IclR family transcriptional regulator